VKVLRPFQVTHLDRAMRALRSTGRAFVQSATGTGKALLLAKTIEDWLRSIAATGRRGRAIVLVHREELVRQLAATIRAETGLTVGIEQAENTVAGTSPDVVVASVPTLFNAARRERFGRKEFDLVVCDECHHFCADHFKDVLDYFLCPRIGLTATPERADGKSLTAVFGPIVSSYRMARGMRDGFLSPAFRKVVFLADLDLSGVRPRAGDFDRAELEQMLLRLPLVEAMAKAVMENLGQRRGVQFCAGVAHAQALATRINGLAVNRIAVAADGEDRSGVAEFTSGAVRVLTNCDLVSEGVDIPDISLVGLPITKSLTRATQTMGRGTRLSPETGKDSLLVLEFQGTRSSGQVTTVDVVGSDLPQRVRSAAEQLLDRSPAMSVLDALERAAATAGCNVITAAPRTPRAVIDPMRLILSLDGMVMEAPRPGAKPATPVQIKMLEAEGLRVAGIDVRQAAMLLNGIRWRRERRRSTPAQALQLQSMGFRPDVSAVEALRTLAQMNHRAA